MAALPNTRRWLVAAWPGMGNVAVIAAGYLVQKQGMRAVGEVAPKGHFDVQTVDVKEGVVATPHVPRSLLFRPDKPEIDLTVFLGEAQPVTGNYAFAHELLDRAAQLGIDRIITFASMASQLHPSQEPKVHGAATHAELLEDLQRAEVSPLDEGQIGGLNGVLLGAAAERNIRGICLLGEIPFFAAGVPNPKAAMAVLQAFTSLVGLSVDMEELAEHARTIDKVLLDMLARLEKNEEEGEGEEEPDEDEEEAEESPAAAEGDKGLEPKDKTRIESLFAAARKDRSKAVELKRELDRLGVFKQYENKFLDLFRRAD